MDKPHLPYEIFDLLSDSIALFDSNQQIVYANAEFNLFTNTFAEHKSLYQELKDLVREFQKLKKRFISEPFFISSVGKTYNVSIFALNHRGRNKQNVLMLIRKNERIRSPMNTLSEDLVNAYTSKYNLLRAPLAPELQALKGEDIQFRLALISAQKVARSHLPVIIQGESGTGKEIMAQAIHALSHRSQAPFVDINCAAIPDTLIESELFGYEKGAFTGAKAEGKLGLIEEADRGTLFLDEIGDISLSAQSKILRVLEEKKFRRVGGTKNRVADVRIISSTNCDLQRMIANRRFREDLYYRINTILIKLPPLRNRGHDISLLARHFLNEDAEERKMNFSFSEETLHALERYSWPGNVRELRGVIDYAVTMSEKAEITIHSLPSFVLLHKNPQPEEHFISHDTLTSESTPLLPCIIKELERSVIKATLENAKSKSEAIKTLGISRRAFYYKLKEYGLESSFG